MRAEVSSKNARKVLHALENHIGQQHYVIYGKTFQSALDQDGNALPTGADHDHPWLAIAPSPNRRCHGSPTSNRRCCFQSGPSPVPPHPSPEDRPFLRHMVSDRIEIRRLVQLAATADWTAKQNIIPTDPGGNVTTSRFRRTLAWFIYRNPVASPWGAVRTPARHTTGSCNSPRRRRSAGCVPHGRSTRPR